MHYTPGSTTQIHSIHHPTDPQREICISEQGRIWANSVAIDPYSFKINPLFIETHRLVLAFLLKNEIFCPKYGSVHFLEFWYWTTSSRFSPVHWFAFPIQAKELYVGTSVMWSFHQFLEAKKRDGAYRRAPIACPPILNLQLHHRHVRCILEILACDLCWLMCTQKKKKSKTQSDLFKIKFISGDTTQL